MSSLRQLVGAPPGVTLYSRVPTSNVTSAAPVGAENTHAPPGRPIVLVVIGCGCSVGVVVARVVAVVGGTVLLALPIGGKVSVVVEPSSTVHAASIVMPIATLARRFMTLNGRSPVTGWRTMAALRNAMVLLALIAGCSANAVATETSVPLPATTAASTATVPPPTSAAATTAAATTTTRPRPLLYVFPFTGKKVSYAHTHHDYPASDVFGCGAEVVAPVGGTVDQTRTTDPWDPKVNDPATRGGKYVSMLGDDGVRYYFAHLESIDVQPGDLINGGASLGVMGQTGNAQKSVCHTHFGISWPCDGIEWAVRRGEVWPWKYLDAWRDGEQLSPVDEVAATEAEDPNACNLARAATSAADA